MADADHAAAPRRTPSSGPTSGEAPSGEAPFGEAPSGRTYRHDGPHLAGKVPPRDAQLAAPISGQVTIHWDRWGIAHIRAARPADLYFDELAAGAARPCPGLYGVDCPVRLD